MECEIKNICKAARGVISDEAVQKCQIRKDVGSCTGCVNFSYIVQQCSGNVRMDRSSREFLLV